MSKKLILSGILLVTVVIISISVLAAEKKNGIATENPDTPSEETGENPPGDDDPVNQIVDGRIILFYGNGCPHCIKVEEFLDTNKASEKTSYEMKEVWGSDENRDLMMEKVAACGMDSGTVGVPFLWDGESGTCLIGDEQVIEFFQAKLDAVGQGVGQNVE